jgi:hypothetical protein
MSLKTENSRRVAKSHPVCMDLKAGFPLANFFARSEFFICLCLSTGTNWIKKKEKFASREKIRKWKTGLRAPLTATLTSHV